MNNPSKFVFLSSAQRRLLDGGAGILCYHYLGTPPPRSNDPYLYLSAECFRGQMKALRDSAYSVTDLSSAIAGGNGAGKIAITVDDGSVNFFNLGVPILAEYGFRAIQFIVAGQIGGINEWDSKHGHPVVPLMGEGQIREWIAAGHEIGSHSMTHRNLSKLDEEEARHQIHDSKKKLEDTFGVPIRHFSYPHGKFTPLIQDLVAEAGYETACTTVPGVHGHGTSPTAVPRIQPFSSGQLIGKAMHRICQKLKLRP